MKSKVLHLKTTVSKSNHHNAITEKSLLEVNDILYEIYLICDIIICNIVSCQLSPAYLLLTYKAINICTCVLCIYLCKLDMIMCEVTIRYYIRVSAYSATPDRN